MNQEAKLYRITQLLSRFKEQVNILNSNGEFSINIHAENILIKVLNEVYSCKLKNVNYEEGKTYPSIDLRDTEGRIAIQVTSTGNLKKVIYTLDKFIENNLYKEFDKLYIFIITQKQNKYDQEKIDKILNNKFAFTAENIIDRTDIYKELNSQNDLEKIDNVGELLEKQFADNKQKLEKWDLFCKGQHEYDKYITNLYRYLDIKGFSPKINNTLVKLDLANIYVPLELKLEEDIENGECKKNNDKLSIGYSVERALNDFDNLVILGNPGSGKSTVLKHLARNICSNRPFTNEFENQIPIIVKSTEFAKYVSQTSKQLSEYIIDHIDKKFELLLTEKLERNQLILLIDGIDEINVVNLRHDVVDRINSFIAQYPTAKIIVTSRIVGYKETRLNGYFNHLQVVEFKDKQIKQFIKNWYLSISSFSDNKDDLALKKANELYKAIKENRSVLNMASNPLLITIIALIYYQGNTLPEKRASLYEIATSTFLENWVRQRVSKNNSSFDKDLLIELLSPIAFHIHKCYTAGLISERNLKSQLTKEYKRINPYLNPKEEKKDIKDIIDFLREDAGFLFEKGLNENGESMFGFVHQTFQEYFTAIEFKTKWKEGELKDNLDSYVFNSNWFEVIKLSASLFKLNEPSRLGRKYATNFIIDILNINDPYPEIFKPLNIVLQILKDETEIEFVQFIEIIDKVFNEILSADEYKKTDTRHERNREVWTFSHLIGSLLKTKTYQPYLLDRIVNEILNSESKSLKHNLVLVLIEASDIESIRKELITLLKSDDEVLKIQLFNHSTVMPIAKIFRTNEFREEIVKYVNSEAFIKSYNGHLPTQYNCCFEAESGFENIMAFEGIDYKELEKKRETELFLSIRLIENEKIKKDLINFYVFSWGLGEVDNIKEYLSKLKSEYPDYNFEKIENHIAEQEKFKSLGLGHYPILNFKSTDIYSRESEENKFAFIKDENIEFLEYPFQNEALKTYFQEETATFSKFVDIVLKSLYGQSLIFIPKNIDEFINVVKYQRTLHWYSRIDLSGLISFALKNLIVNSQINEEIHQWLKSIRKHEYRRTNFDSSINKEELILNIKSSDLILHEKLFLISKIGEKADYQELLKPTIDSLRSEKEVENRKEIQNVLYEVL